MAQVHLRLRKQKPHDLYVPEYPLTLETLPLLPEFLLRVFGLSLGVARAMSKDGAPTPAVVQALDEEISSIT